MKTILTMLLMLCALALRAQTYMLNYDTYDAKEVKPEFDSVFVNKEDRTDFKKLREFLYEKEELLKKLGGELNTLPYYTDTGKIAELELRAATLESKLGKQAGDTLSIASTLMEDPDYYRSYAASPYMRTVTRDEVQAVIATIRNKITQMRSDVRRKYFLSKNLAHVQQDIQICKLRLDATLAPEYKQQAFRESISKAFALLIALLLVVFFTVVFFKAPSSVFKELIGDYGLQFVTIFVLIIVIVLFGILDILKSSELAAILSGISGYILGKGKGTSITTSPLTTPPPDAGNSHEPGGVPPAPVIQPQSVTIKV